MSISIHNGFRLTGQTPLALQTAFTKAMTPVLLKRAHQMIFADALYRYDLATVGEEKLTGIYQRLMGKDNATVASWNELWDSAYTAFMDDSFNARYLNAKAVFLTGSDGYDYAMVYGIDTEDVFSELDGVEEFPYWNSSEHPDDMTEEQWKDRLNTWESVLDFYRSVESQGVVIEAQVEPFSSLAQVYENRDTCFEMREDHPRIWRLAADLAVYNARDSKEVSDILSVMFDDVAMKKYADELAPGLLPISHESIMEGIDTRA